MSAGIYFQRKQVLEPCLLGEKLLRKTLHMCRYMTAGVLAVGFVRISIIHQSSSNGHFVHWHADNSRLTRTLSWEGPFRNVTKWLELLLLLAGTTKYCPIYYGKRKGPAEVVRGM